MVFHCASKIVNEVETSIFYSDGLLCALKIADGVEASLFDFDGFVLRLEDCGWSKCVHILFQ